MTSLTAICLLFACTVSDAAIQRNEIADIVKNAGILPQQYASRVSASDIKDGLCAVGVFRNPKTSESDCKIDAVLITKKLVEADKEIMRVIVAFYSESNKSDVWYTEVRNTDLSAYALGGVDKEKLLATLPFQRGEGKLKNSYASVSEGASITAANAVVEGPLKGRRLSLLGTMQNLERQGMDVRQFQTAFKTMETNAARGNEAEVTKATAYLARSIEQARQAHERASGSDAVSEAKRAQKIAASGYKYQTTTPRAAGEIPNPDVEPEAYGKFLPFSNGPGFERRCRIGYRLNQLEKAGKLADAHRSYWTIINTYAQKLAQPHLQQQEYLFYQKLDALDYSLGFGKQTTTVRP